MGRINIIIKRQIWPIFFPIAFFTIWHVRTQCFTDKDNAAWEDILLEEGMVLPNNIAADS